MTQVPPEPQYVGAHANIGKGMKSFANGNGTVVIGGDVLALYDGKQRLIASAPLSSVEVMTGKMFLGTGYYMVVDGTKYAVSWTSNAASGVGGLVAGGIGQSIGALAGGHGSAKEFKTAYEALSGHSIK